MADTRTYTVVLERNEDGGYTVPFSAEEEKVAETASLHRTRSRYRIDTVIASF